MKLSDKDQADKAKTSNQNTLNKVFISSYRVVYNTNVYSRYTTGAVLFWLLFLLMR